MALSCIQIEPNLLISNDIKDGVCWMGAYLLLTSTKLRVDGYMYL